MSQAQGDAAAEEALRIAKAEDGFRAMVVLGVAVVVVLIAVFFLFRSKKVSLVGGGVQSGFTPPPERAAYLEGKNKLNLSRVPELDELKKLLMRRAMKTIPILLSLQNEGSSIDRLYKRGMLTDDMHFKVRELKAFVDQEFADIQSEADDLVEGWGQHIWPQAMQFHQMIQKQSEDQRNAEEAKKKAELEKVGQPLVDAETNRAAEAEKNAQKVADEEEAAAGGSATKKKTNKKK